MNQETPPKKPKKPNLFLRLLALLVTAVLVLGALVLVVYRDRFNLDALKRWMAYRELETGETGEAAPFTHAGGDKLSVAYLDSGVVLASASGAHYYSFSGEQYAEQVRAMEHPVLSASDRAGVVYDAGGQSLFVFRSGQQSMDLELEGGADLLSARINDSGWLAVTAQQSGYKGSVTVYNPKGEKVIQISLSSTFLVDAALSPDCKTVAVITIDQSGGSFRSQVQFYPVNETEPRAVVDLGGCAVLDMDYETGRLWLLGEDRLLIVAPESGEVQTWSFGRSYLKGCSFGGDGFALVLTGRYRAGSANQALIVLPDGTVGAALELSVQVLDYDCAGNYCALLTGSSLTIYDWELSPYAILADTQSARYAALSPNGSALLADAQKAWLYIPS